MGFSIRTDGMEAAARLLSERRFWRAQTRGSLATTGDLNPALTPLEFYPETAVLLHGLQMGLGGRGRFLRLLQQRGPEAARRFQELLPPGRDHSLEEIAALHLDDRTRPTRPIREVVLPAGDPSFSSEELPILLGGLFIFNWLGWAEVPLALNWTERYSPFPLTVPSLHPFRKRTINPKGLQGAIDQLLGRELAPDRWNSKERGTSQTIDTGFELAADGEFLGVSAKIIYPPDGGRRDSRIFARSSPSLRHAATVPPFLSFMRQFVIDDGGPPFTADGAPGTEEGSYGLAKAKDQYFFFPGAVWRVRRSGGAVNDFPYRSPGSFTPPGGLSKVGGTARSGRKILPSRSSRSIEEKRKSVSNSASRVGELRGRPGSPSGARMKKQGFHRTGATRSSEEEG